MANVFVYPSLTMRTSFLATVLRRWPVVALCVVVGVASAYGITRGLPREYKSATTVLVQVSSASNAQDAYAADQLAQQLVPSLAHVAESSAAAVAVERALGLSAPPSLTAAPVPATTLISITATASSPKLAAAEANSAATIFDLEAGAFTAPAHTVSVKVVDPATAPLSPSSPATHTDVIYGGLVGLLVGLAAAWVLFRLDRSFRSMSDLVGIPVGPVLATVPRLRTIRRGRPSIDAVIDRRGAEAYNSLATAIRFLSPERPVRSVLFVSPNGQAGKTVTVTNLAEAMARAGETVVAIDADLRSASLTRGLGLEQDEGLTSVLAGENRLGDVVLWRDRLGVLPAGRKPPNPGQTLGTAQMRILIRAIQSQTDRVLIDGTSLPALSDSLPLAGMVDGVVLVLRPGQSHRADVAEACRRLDLIGARLVGCVLNYATSESDPTSDLGTQRQASGGLDTSHHTASTAGALVGGVR